MNIKNAFAVCFNNFMLVWKQLLYTIIIGLIVALTVFELVKPIVNLLTTTGWTLEVKQFIETVYTSPKVAILGLKTLCDNLWNIIFSNFGSIWGSSVFIFLFAIFVPSFFYSISVYTQTELLNSKLNSWVKYGFMQKYISCLKRSVIYSLYKFLFAIPLICVLFLFVYLYGFLVNTWLGATLTLPLLILCAVVVLALNKTLYLWIAPISCTRPELNISKSLIANFKEIRKPFGRLFLSEVILMFIKLFSILCIGIFTLGAGLILVVPVIPIIDAAFSLVTYYSHNKLRFYIAEDTIVNPL